MTEYEYGAMWEDGLTLWYADQETAEEGLDYWPTYLGTLVRRPVGEVEVVDD